MEVTQRLRRVLGRQAPLREEMPSRVLEGDAPRIHDGVDYTLPVLLPAALRRHLQAKGELDAWLTEQTNVNGSAAYSDYPVATTEDPLREWDPATRERVASSCHSAVQRNPIAKRAVHYISAFVVGDGFNLTCKNKDVEALLQEFIDNPDNAIREYERQAVIDLCVDGELFLRFFTEAGEVVVVPLRPWECSYIHTEAGFFRRPLRYHFQPNAPENPDDPDGSLSTAAYDVPAADMLHVAINRHSYELRGRPELYSALPWLRAHKEWQENRARQNYWRGALLWWVKITAAAPGVIAAKLAQYLRPPTPGSTVVTSDKEEWSALSNPVGAGDASEDGRQLKIMALNGIGGIPEYMTGDGENASLASTKSQQLPVLKTFSEFQTIMIEQVWYPMFRRVLQTAMDEGLIAEEVEEQDADGDPVREEPKSDDAPTALPPPTFAPSTGAPNGGMPPLQRKTPIKKIKTLDAFDVQYEPVGDTEPFTLAQALDIAANNGWISNQTATTELGFDYAIEQKRIQRERAKDLEAMARGEIPTPPEFTPPDTGDGQSDEKQRAVA